MPSVARPDGAEIAWRAQGEGPPVLISNLGYAPPAFFLGLIEDLAADHRVLVFDPRGTGASSARGPYDLATDAADMLAVIEAAEAAGALVVGNGDGANRAVKAAALAPEAIDAVVLPGSLTLPGAAGGLADSRSVLNALILMLENDYRAGLHAMVSSGNPELDEQTVQSRVELIVAHARQDAMVDRMRSWIREDPSADAAALGDRLWILHHEANPWFPHTDRAREMLPEAHHEQIDDGPMSRPELTAAFVRQLTRTAAP